MRSARRAIATTTSTGNITASAISVIRPIRAASISTCRPTIRASACPVIAACSPSIGMNKLVTERQGAFTPFDYAEKQGQNVTGGFTRMFAPGLELIVDGGVRRKAAAGAVLHVATETLRAPGAAAGCRHDAHHGVIHAAREDRFEHLGAADQGDRRLRLLPRGLRFGSAAAASAPRRSIATTSCKAAPAFYWQQTVSILPITDISVGGRIQQTKIARARCVQ